MAKANFPSISVLGRDADVDPDAAAAKLAEVGQRLFNGEALEYEIQDFLAEALNAAMQAPFKQRGRVLLIALGLMPRSGRQHYFGQKDRLELGEEVQQLHDAGIPVDEAARKIAAKYGTSQGVAIRCRTEYLSCRDGNVALSTHFLLPEMSELEAYGRRDVDPEAAAEFLRNAAYRFLKHEPQELVVQKELGRALMGLAEGPADTRGKRLLKALYLLPSNRRPALGEHDRMDMANSVMRMRLNGASEEEAVQIVAAKAGIGIATVRNYMREYNQLWEAWKADE
ncbi:hypothetical protein [Chitinilyticum litopenaei]|uniref:hypothetical protein n=1 Tax=Chitinilyticum litopenaei TaxID=1121276 RepID=UPI0005B7D7DB|nr:hypothetical protein [Chitinilyticum litopenaei]